MINEMPVPGARQVRDHHSIPAAPRHNFNNVERRQNYGYQMKKMNEGLIDLKNHKNEKALLNLDGSCLENSRLNFDLTEDGPKGMGALNYQAQKKNNA